MESVRVPKHRPGLLATVLLCGWPLWACAHGDLHLQILDLTKQIDQSPTNAELYLRRGELHRAHLDWDAAQADYDRAAAIDAKLPAIDFVRGRMFLEANWPLSAKVALDRFLSRHTNHVEGLVTRARVLVKLEQRLAAARDYSLALAHSVESRPELYLERAQALAAEGVAHLDEAIEGLDEGIAKLGPLVTLQLAAIDLELKQQRYDQALARVDKVAAQSPRKESWHERRGKILQQAGRSAEAAQAYQAALDALKLLPPARRNVPAMLDLEKRVRAALDSLDSPSPSSGTKSQQTQR